MKNIEWKTIPSFWEDLLCHVCFRGCKQWLMIDSEVENFNPMGFVSWFVDAWILSTQNKKALLMD